MARTTTTGGGALTPMWRSIADDGEAIADDGEGDYKLVEPDPNDYCTPPKGTRAKLRISGISETFQMPTYNDPEKMENKVRLEYLIINLSGNNIGWMKGKRFTQIFTERVSAKSALGEMFAALSGQPIPASTEGYPFDGFIGTEFVTLIGENQSGTHAKVNPEAIETAKTVLSPAVAAYFSGNGTAPVAAVTKTASKVGAMASAPEPQEPDDDFVTDADL